MSEKELIIKLLLSDIVLILFTWPIDVMFRNCSQEFENKYKEISIISSLVMVTSYVFFPVLSILAIWGW